MIRKRVKIKLFQTRIEAHNFFRLALIKLGPATPLKGDGNLKAGKGKIGTQICFFF